MDTERSGLVQPDGLGHSAMKALRRTGSSTSLTSLVDPHTGEGRIRVCNYCKQVKDKHNFYLSISELNF